MPIDSEKKKKRIAESRLLKIFDMDRPCQSMDTVERLLETRVRPGKKV